MSEGLRVIIDSARPGAENMARDEAILLAVHEGQTGPTLRFYQWSEPTISLGYFQRHAEVAAQDDAVRVLPVVRRQTGGGAILHDLELTYSLALPTDHPQAEIETMYRLVHDAFLDVLARVGVAAAYRGGDDRGNAQRGPFFCFARQHRLDLVVGPDKLLGSAQRRIRHAALQHGSLMLASRFAQQPCTHVAAHAGELFDLADFVEATAAAVADRLGHNAAPGQMSTVETARARDLLAKYDGPDWTCQR